MGIVELIKEYGVKNIRFFIPMSPMRLSGIIPGIAFEDDTRLSEIVECQVTERQYCIADNYKIELLAFDIKYGYQRFYISDLELLIKQHPDQYKVYVLTIDGYQRLTVS